MFELPWRTGSTAGAGRLVRGGLLAAALGVYLSTAGCGTISVNDDTPAPPPNYNQVSAPLNTDPRHDLAILGVDFDPALDVQRLMNHEPVSLVVGVSNQGNQAESRVQVKADLWSADGSRRLLHIEQLVDSIAAGDVQPVRLTNAGTPPYFSRYHLTVEIVPVPGETNTQNNTRTLDIVVHSD